MKNNQIQIKNSTVFITGASKGAGLAVCRELINAGAKVFMTAKSKHELLEVCRKIDSNGDRAFFTVMNAADSVSVKNAVAEALEVFEKIDLLINNVEVTYQQRVQVPDSSFAGNETHINYLGTFLVAQTLLPSMLVNKSGMIINVASAIGKSPTPTQANRCASQAAVIAYSSSLRSEVEDYGITVKTFIPGVTLTDLMNSFTPGVTLTDLMDSYQIEPSQVMPLEEIAAHMMQAINSNKPEYICDSDNLDIIRLCSFCPEWLTRRIKIILKS
ncbi:MAG: SDR family NAD(P)-dependent oxidoreductase [Bacteroidota bacterium]|nr:SDR family NAD(P)-dependent oxidoreductase [Bacteroidota bacterium]